MNSTSIFDSTWRLDDQPEAVIWVVSTLLLLSLLLPLSMITIYCYKRRRRHSYTISYRAPIVSRNFDGGTIRLTRHFSLSGLDDSIRFHTLPRHSIVRPPGSDTIIEYEEEGPEVSI